MLPEPPQALNLPHFSSHPILPGSVTTRLEVPLSTFSSATEDSEERLVHSCETFNPRKHLQQAGLNPAPSLGPASTLAEDLVSESVCDKINLYIILSVWRRLLNALHWKFSNRAQRFLKCVWKLQNFSLSSTQTPSPHLWRILKLTYRNFIGTYSSRIHTFMIKSMANWYATARRY